MPANPSEEEDQTSQAGGGMSVTEKMTLWSTFKDLGIPSEEDAVPQPLDEVEMPPKYREVRSYLLGGPAYKWLLGNARSSAILTDTKGTILETIKGKIDSVLASMGTGKSRCTNLLQAEICMDWDLPGFLKEQDYGTTPEIAVERAVTITGSIVDAQALTCADYMCQTWPSSGRGVLCMLQDALMSPTLSCSGKQLP
jgi:hypothetical protein